LRDLAFVFDFRFWTSRRRHRPSFLTARQLKLNAVWQVWEIALGKYPSKLRAFSSAIPWSFIAVVLIAAAISHLVVRTLTNIY
jgi:hypothetical protein